MIVPMQKVWLVAREADRERTLDALAALGVVHVAPVTPPDDRALESVREQAVRFERVLRLLPEATGERHPDNPLTARDAADRVLLYAEDRDRVEQEIHDRRIELARTAPYGDFRPASIAQLAEKGVGVALIRYHRKSPPTLPEGAQLHILSEQAGECFAALIGPDAMSVEHTEPLPRLSLSEQKQELTAAEQRLTTIDSHLQALAAYRPDIERALADARDVVRRHEVALGMGSDRGLIYLQGYCPADVTDRLTQASNDAGWGLLIREPDPDDAVPTLVRNPVWVRPIKAVFQMIGLLPGYREIDISSVFLVFFSLFFAILIGDAGYGVLFLVLTLLARRKWRKAPSYPFTLLKILSICTIVWGTITGNWFGVTDLPAPMQGLTIGWLRGEQSDHNVMLLCFFIGALHLSVAHAWNAIRVINSTKALAQVGWILLSWTMFLTARTMILGADFPPVGYILLTTGLILVLLFMTPPRALKQEWANHVMLPLDVISNFVDVVSYVRLFAVGSASLAVAAAFNTMAANIGASSAVAGLGAALILFFGHTLNILLCAMGILVHGVRLNTLEFSGHIGMQWTGIAYNPFRKDSAEKSDRVKQVG